MTDDTTVYVTLGVKYKTTPHPYLPGRFSDPDGVIEVRARSYEDARELINYIAGNQWAFMYPSLDSISPQYRPLGITAVVFRKDGFPVIWAPEDFEAHQTEEKQ